VVGDFDGDGRLDAAFATGDSIGLLISAPPPTEGSECGPPRFHRGDPNDDGREDLSDAVSLLEHCFLGGTAPGCREAADADDSGAIDITDAIVILGHLFLGGVPPAPPGPPPAACRADPPGSPAIGCDSYRSCEG
jgi:hypothetical protein